MTIDLHSHTTASDGSYSPDELLAYAYDIGIKTLAITDHDTLAGYLVASRQDTLGINLIAGVEVSCHHLLIGGYGKHAIIKQMVHIVGLNIQDVPTMQAALQGIQKSRANRGWEITNKMATLVGISTDELWQKVLAKADHNSHSVGRAHIAQVLSDMGVVKTTQDAFDKYLADNKSAYVPLQTLSMNETIALIHRCDGLAVLAHPTRYRLSATRVRRLIADFAKVGGDGCELPAFSEPISTRQMIDRSIDACHLMVSVGSDFHGASMPWRKLGQVPTLKDGQIPIWSKF